MSNDFMFGSQNLTKDNAMLKAALEAKDAEIEALESANDGLICTRDRLEAKTMKLRAALEDAGHYVALCPPPAEATGALRIELLERRERIAKAAALEQSATDGTNERVT